MNILSWQFFALLFVTLTLYYLLPSVCQPWILLIFSLWFVSTGGASCVFFLLATAALSFIGALLIEKKHRDLQSYVKGHPELSRDGIRRRKKLNERQRLHLVQVIGAMIAALIFIGKYVGLYDGGRAIGISFYGLQALGYVIDVNRGVVEAQRKPLRHLLYISFFPLLVEGPIERAGHLMPQLVTPHAFHADAFFPGFLRLCYGLFLKLVLADRLSPIVEALSGIRNNGAAVFVVMIAYSLQLYADFSGGIHACLGIASMFGVHPAENFLCPYFAHTFQEYWRRWHISLGSWFRDYVFYPVSISIPVMKISAHLKSRKTPARLASAVVWLFTGLWHGVSLEYVLWGLLNHTLLMLSSDLEPLARAFRRKHPRSAATWFPVLQAFRTFLIVSMTKLFDVYHGLPVLAGSFLSFIGRWKVHEIAPYLPSYVDAFIIILSLVLAFYVDLIFYRMGFASKGEDVDESSLIESWYTELPIWRRLCYFYFLLFAILLFGQYGIGYTEQAFIYDRF